MSTDPDTRMRSLAGATPPMENGEIVFAAPWEARAFGMVHSLCDAGTVDWHEFRDRLIHRIGQWDAEHPVDAEDESPRYDYYRHWLAALEDVLDANAIAERDLAHKRATALADRPHGHDH